MKIGTLNSLLLVVAVAGADFSAASAQQATTARIAEAKPGEVRVLASGALSAPLEEVRAQAQAAVGRSLVIEYGPSRSLQAQIESDQPFEVALLSREVRDAMIARGKILEEGQADVASVVLAVGQRGPAPPQDVSTPEALKTTLLGAKAIRYFEVGASIPQIEKTFAALDVGDLLRDRIVLLGAGRRVQDPALGPGEYEVILNLASEVIPPTSGWTFLGTVPSQFQIPVVIVAAIGAKGDVERARALIEFLQGPTIEPALKRLGMTR